MNITVMNLIESASGRLEKEALLKREKDTRFLKWGVDDSTTFGVTVDTAERIYVYSNQDRKVHNYEVKDWWNEFDVLCTLLSNRDLTGHEARDAVNAMLLNAPTETDMVWACRVLNKDLRCGVNRSTLVKVFPSLIDPFKCALAHPYDPDKHVLKGDWMLQEKLDGLRMVVVNGVPYTRTGKVLESVGHILKELTLSDAIVFDGEVMGTGGFDAASGKTRKKGNGPDLSLVYHVFDVIKLEEWQTKKTAPLSARMETFNAYFAQHGSKEHVKDVPYKVMENPTLDDLKATRDSMISRGYEGVMAKNMAAPYNFKRSNDLLKYKFMKDADGIVVDVIEGTGKYVGMMGAIAVKVDGVVTEVGTGFSDDDRADIWKRRNAIIGKWCEIHYQDLLVSGKMRFPAFARWRPDKDE